MVGCSQARWTLVWSRLMAEKPKITDAEFQLAERRIPVRWGAILRWTFWTAVMCFGVYYADDPVGRVGVVLGGVFWLAIGPLFGLLTKPSLQPEEVEQLAERLRENVRPGRGRR